MNLKSKNIKSDKVDIKNNLWLAYDAKVFKNGNSNTFDVYKIKSNFNYKKYKVFFKFIITVFN